MDPTDASRNSIYVTFGGMSEPGQPVPRLWHFNGTRWEPRIGIESVQSLLDVEHNAIIVDPANPRSLFVGTDIGVWHSDDAGRHWAPLDLGLPDAPVFDLQVHPAARLLRAATYGRGVFELDLG